MIHKGLDGLLIDVNGVGFRVEAPLSTLARLPDPGERVALFIHTHVRDEAIRLFGFQSKEGLQLFERLIGVSGVGPRMALSALSHLAPDELRKAIIHGDARQLSRIPGIGKKTAERIIVDLSEAMQQPGVDMDGSVQAPMREGRALLAELEEALKYLGYKDREVQRAVMALSAQQPIEGDIETLLKQTLKLLK
ncbi:MAG: Holliday junction branch migration protein RuvA [Bradymonadales bacterium]|nr:Holliday junction branch migration protein RuvA [Bradymonadales bacterium]